MIGIVIEVNDENWNWGLKSEGEGGGPVPRLEIGLRGTVQKIFQSSPPPILIILHGMALT